MFRGKGRSLEWFLGKFKILMDLVFYFDFLKKLFFFMWYLYIDWFEVLVNILLNIFGWGYLIF